MMNNSDSIKENDTSIHRKITAFVNSHIYTRNVYQHSIAMQMAYQFHTSFVFRLCIWFECSELENGCMILHLSPAAWQMFLRYYEWYNILMINIYILIPAKNAMLHLGQREKPYTCIKCDGMLLFTNVYATIHNNCSSHKMHWLLSMIYSNIFI